MTISILAAALLAQTPAPATGAPAATSPAPAWEPLGPPQNGLTYAVDPASVARTGDRVSIRMRTLRAAPDPNGITSAVLSLTIDCRARTGTLDGVDLFKADGSLDRSIAGEDPQPIGSDPTQRALFERACRPAAAAPGGN